MKEEFENALRGLKSNKAPTVYLIAAELLQNLGQAEKNMIFELVVICTKQVRYQTITSLTKLDEDQFGLRKERGTREALPSLRLI